MGAVGIGAAGGGRAGGGAHGGTLGDCRNGAALVPAYLGKLVGEELLDAVGEEREQGEVRGFFDGRVAQDEDVAGMNQ